MLRTPQDRGPQEVILTIPAGTAERVARGEKEPSIPSDMIFVQGDTLVVKNQDTALHKLGPMFIPAGTEATMHLDTVASYAYACSFQPGQYIGLDVREATTLKTRLTGILFGGLPIGALFSVYALMGIPYKKKVE
ncbi:MAG TPA: hypothetical protein VHM28_03940 [Anaerolineales bacterium]|nr:hypothetical protein [Anaerolineales bacterium]